eukprot:6186321-Pleurochrysis_carterae.AAC.3
MTSYIAGSWISYIHLCLLIPCLLRVIKVRAETPVSDSIKVLPAVLYYGGRAGELAPTLKVKGLPATLSPHEDAPLVKAVELRVASSRPCMMPLDKALEALGIEWTPVEGADHGDDAAAGTCAGQRRGGRRVLRRPEGPA